MKKTIKLNESQLHSLIAESVKKVLKEDAWDYDKSAPWNDRSFEREDEEEITFYGFPTNLDPLIEQHPELVEVFGPIAPKDDDGKPFWDEVDVGDVVFTYSYTNLYVPNDWEKEYEVADTDYCSLSDVEVKLAKDNPLNQQLPPEAATLLCQRIKEELPEWAANVEDLIWYAKNSYEYKQKSMNEMKTIKLNESQFKSLINESVKRVLREMEGVEDPQIIEKAR